MPKPKRFELAGKKLAEHYKERGIKLSEGIIPKKIPIVHNIPDEVVFERPPMDGNVGVFVSYLPSKKGVASLAVDFKTQSEDKAQGMFSQKPENRVTVMLDLQNTKKGILIKNAQAYPTRSYDYTGIQPFSNVEWDSSKSQGRSQEIDKFHKFVDEKIGMRVGLDVLKAMHPKKQIHIIAPHEIRKSWGKSSKYYLGMGELWDYIHKKHPEKYYTLVAKALVEHPDFERDMRKNYPDLLGNLDEVDKIIERYKKSGKKIPGSRLLKRAIAEYSRDKTKEGSRRPLGRRRSKAYYSDIPQEHGFVRNKKPIDFGVDEYGDKMEYHVLTYDPNSPENKNMQVS